MKTTLKLTITTLTLCIVASCSTSGDISNYTPAQHAKYYKEFERRRIEKQKECILDRQKIAQMIITNKALYKSLGTEINSSIEASNCENIKSGHKHLVRIHDIFSDKLRKKSGYKYKFITSKNKKNIDNENKKLFSFQESKFISAASLNPTRFNVKNIEKAVYLRHKENFFYKRKFKANSFNAYTMLYALLDKILAAELSMNYIDLKNIKVCEEFKNLYGNDFIEMYLFTKEIIRSHKTDALPGGKDLERIFNDYDNKADFLVERLSNYKCLINMKSFIYSKNRLKTLKKTL